jgi:hypothetical protein
MKNKKTNILTILAFSVLLIVGAGCGRETKSSTGSVTSAGRQITYSIDGPASIAGTDPLIIKFGNHKLERQGGNFLLDGRNIGGVGGTDKIDIVVSNSILTMSSGNNTLTIPVAR